MWKISTDKFDCVIFPLVGDVDYSSSATSIHDAPSSGEPLGENDIGQPEGKIFQA